MASNLASGKLTTKAKAQEALAQQVSFGDMPDSMKETADAVLLIRAVQSR